MNPYKQMPRLYLANVQRQYDGQKVGWCGESSSEKRKEKKRQETKTQ